VPINSFSSRSSCRGIVAAHPAPVSANHQRGAVLEDTPDRLRLSLDRADPTLIATPSWSDRFSFEFVTVKNLCEGEKDMNFIARAMLS
jgi:hypothetical protein